MPIDDRRVLMAVQSSGVIVPLVEQLSLSHPSVSDSTVKALDALALDKKVRIGLGGERVVSLISQ